MDRHLERRPKTVRVDKDRQEILATPCTNMSHAFPARGTRRIRRLSIDVMSDTGMCSDGETAATGNTAFRIAANTAG
jgi:hypothetical protein